MTAKTKTVVIPEGLRLIDTHTHLYLSDSYPGGESEAAVRRAIDAGVEFMILPGINGEAMDEMERLHRAFPDNTALAAGVHPDDLTDDWEAQLAAVRERMKEGNYIAVGEVGIDLYRDTSKVRRQMEAFETQLGWAEEDRLPVIIHCREGLDETLEVIGNFGADELPRLLFHSFTGDVAQAERVMERVPGAMFGINGVATFKNAPEVREAVKTIGAGRILLETDAPYLAPVPKRGTRNESALLPYIAVSVADTLGMDVHEFAEKTTASARRFFGL